MLGFVRPRAGQAVECAILARDPTCQRREEEHKEEEKEDGEWAKQKENGGYLFLKAEKKRGDTWREKRDPKKAAEEEVAMAKEAAIFKRGVGCI